MTDPRSALTLAEIDDLSALSRLHRVAVTAKDYVTADLLRTTLMDWGAWPPEKGWHPVFESSAHRRARLEQRENEQHLN